MATREQIRAFAARPWSELAELKAEHWVRWKREHGVAGAIWLADELRRQVIARRPEWPTPADRADDLRCHLRVAEALRRVPAGNR